MRRRTNFEVLSINLIILNPDMYPVDANEYQYDYWRTQSCYYKLHNL
jgi:hypothetical protein